jgi:hypothetical protein
MNNACAKHRHVPGPPIITRTEALQGLQVATEHGTDRTVAVAFIDIDARPLTMVIVDDCPGAAADVLTVVELVARVARDADSNLATIAIGVGRPGSGALVTADDLAVWPRILETCRDVRISLMDWWILSDGRVNSVSDAAHFLGPQ